MATEEQKRIMLEMAQKSTDLLHQQVALMRSVTPELFETDPDQVAKTLDQVDALTLQVDAARKELDDYRNSVLSGTEE